MFLGIVKAFGGILKGERGGGIEMLAFVSPSLQALGQFDDL